MLVSLCSGAFILAETVSSMEVGATLRFAQRLWRSVFPQIVVDVNRRIIDYGTSLRRRISRMG